MQESQEYSWKNLRSDCYRHWRASISSARCISLTAGLLTLRLSVRFRTLLRKMTAFTCTLTLGLMIQSIYSTPSDFSLVLVGVGMSSWITLLWLCQVLEGITKGGLSTIFRRGLKCSSKNSSSLSSSSVTSTTTDSPEAQETFRR